MDSQLWSRFPMEIFSEILKYLPVHISVSLGNEGSKRALLRRISLPLRWRSADPTIIRWLMRYEVGGYDFVFRGNFPDFLYTWTAGSGHVDLLTWLWERIPFNNYVACVILTHACVGGDILTMQFCLERMPGSFDAIDVFYILATRGHLPVMQFLMEHGQVCMRDTMDGPCKAGQLRAAVWIHENGVGTCGTLAMDVAAGAGHLDIVQFLHVARTEGCTTDAMDDAASNGHLEIVQFLHLHRSEGCTDAAMDQAAAHGHLLVVQFLHEYRTEGCTRDAIDGAVEGGHLDVVKFLHQNRSEGCTVCAMDIALTNDNWDIVWFLHTQRTEGCSPEAMEWAAREGCINTMTWLRYNRPEPFCTTSSMLAAIEGGHLHAVKWLHINMPPYDRKLVVLAALDKCQPHIFWWFCKQKSVKKGTPNKV